ncbi:MAG TPA: hypothetical protein VMP89_12585, partial [Solirubrobacteraceae bacterium]|nr:hypothetical protein [Solirubrobacteraceae bacterium]
DVEHRARVARTRAARSLGPTPPARHPHAQSGEARSTNRGYAANGLYVDVDPDAEVIVERDGLATTIRRLDVRELAAIFGGGAIGAGLRRELVPASHGLSGTTGTLGLATTPTAGED